ncbi:MAG: UDP-N-acetylglucosamine--N-acetylmuramyl-(pentapeptide) pyrophosphoryl-undecaprenol N-acetylglucosamine transferase [bacterium]|nr:UDP-N-acetylglucosamine--N-acetylmuramyl-(pentapeptide) pyrophosphoryl-undecaprenol N-acetylglucosamine transferase [bacterium]MCY3579027.1 UDP-N-acetylglucosamine--N-acetylmuramyl-(pentapeptide) pyrophosphoryl-undecaprenol N-acetylglucosamine transferase [bacterium]MCY3652637.1 UDP-N-acetylglucosamine--N-acetylmuramyl-(pentapeptide) pyrophosphoryl-undecaprenol N-acetylglucosamine transferase [bacterium]MDE0643008.1 UDP-N-acetylglucosamine--N-acetylmuramyl-(pentapeptide) pyrophosphoryl-undeca
MSFAIAAAGTGGHIIPGLAVAEQLVAKGVGKDRILFIGGNRMEADLIPGEGYPLLQIELQGLVRSLSARNLRIPGVVWRAAGAAGRALLDRQVKAVLCMGSYVTVPVALAARRLGISLYLHEQNVEAGLANRFAKRWADRSLLSFPRTKGMAGEVVGYPLRSMLTNLDKSRVRTEGLERYRLSEQPTTVGVMGGSLGAKVINEAVTALAASWSGPPLQMVHLAGDRKRDSVTTEEDSPAVTRRVLGFEHRMDLFYGVSDLVITRAGAGLMEAAVTGTPSILIPGSFAGKHQLSNARAVVGAEAALLVEESDLGSLGRILETLLADSPRRTRMGQAAIKAVQPGAASTIADMLMDGADAAS